MSIQKELPELINAGVISKENAEKIQDYYANKKGASGNRLLIVFGILGAILIGLGIILIIAHNWDELSRPSKTISSFLPLLIGQIVCGYVLIKKPDSIAWRESATAFLFFAVGACIALIGQIYNIPGNLSSFLLTWMLLCLPLIYLMKSSIASLLYLWGITYYATQTSFWAYPSYGSYLYWLLLLLALPHYYLLYKNKPQSNFMIFHNWIIPLSLVISLGMIIQDMGEPMFIAYFNLFGILYLVGNLEFFNQQKTRNNGYKVLGIFGTIILLLILSFDWFWEELIEKEFPFDEVMAAPEFYATVITFLLASGLFFFEYRNKAWHEIKPLAPVFILFLLTFLLGLSSPIAVILINLLVFAIGILIIREGANQDRLGKLNFGLLTIAALVICRFFDTDISFVTRGILFVVIGAGFFAANYLMLKKRKANG